MADVHSIEVRSYNMSRIRSKNTRPEMFIRKFLHSCGFRFTLHNKKLPGKPDIVLPKYKTVIFVHGCFWHNHKNCRFARMPSSNVDYWVPKIMKNKSRDITSSKALKKECWKVITVWECRLKPLYLEKTLNNIASKLSY